MNVCGFTVAVNRKITQQQRQSGEQPQADYFRVSVWRERGDLCAKYLAKGRKVCVIGPVSVRTYTGNDGTTKASLEVTADEVEFLSSKGEEQPKPQDKPGNSPAVFQQVETDELPF